MAQFDNMRVVQLPRMTLTSDAPLGIAESGREVTIDFEAIGLQCDVQALQFELLDIDHQVVLSAICPVQRTSSVDDWGLPPDSPTPPGVRLPHLISVPRRSPKAAEPEWIGAEAHWRFAPPQAGYYRARARLGEITSQELPLVVLNDHPVEGGPFGWSLASTDSGLAPDQLVELLTRAGVGWVKLPIWVDSPDEEATDALVRLVARLKSRGVHAVGRLERPAYGGSNDRDTSHALAMLEDPLLWEQTLSRCWPA